MRRLPPSRGKGPWAIATFIGIPLFFASLMASTLAQEHPHLVQWKGGKSGLITKWHDPTGANEARIWLWAIVPPIVLSLIGLLCMRIPYGWYVACVAGIVEAIAVVHNLDSWAAHHTQRFSIGVDLVPKTDFASNQYEPGEWEKMAHETALSLSHWTIALAVVSILVMVLLHVRRTYFSRKPYVDAEALPGVHAPDATMPAE